MVYSEILALQNIEGCGPATTRQICEYISRNDKSILVPNDLISLLPELKENKIIKGKLSNISAYDIERAYKKAEEIIEYSTKAGIGFLTIYDSEYPDILKKTINEKGKPDAPLLLYYRGSLSALEHSAIAIIGTREPNNDGIKAGKYFGKQFSEQGFNIVSGLAIGCDTCGHEGALEGNGVTTAFLAHGLDTIYPSQNKELSERIIDKGGLLMSEYPVKTQVSRYTLVARDRLQAGLATSTIVIQTGVKGGTMHAANTTLLAGKKLFAVLYKDMSSQQVQGNIALANRGAQYITSNDIQKVTDFIFKYKDTSSDVQSRVCEPALF